MAGDGQVTFGEVVMKHGARKIRTLQDGTIIAGFAGAVADALTLIEKFEAQLKAWDGNMRRAAVELAKEWRTDRYLRRLEAQLLIAEVGFAAADIRRWRRDRAGRRRSRQSAPARRMPSLPPGLSRPHRSRRARSCSRPRWRSPRRLCIYTNDALH